ncbi:MAG: RluA family pseudouridine synthase, partial [Candidatus Saccharibacteria bacterium]|nr:RluA family pseudouridine synthase [Candidatus Saccharibacteria bacterium]
MKKHFSKPELSRKINGDIPSEKEEVSEEETGKVRVDQLLFLRYPEYSRTAIRKLILSGKLRVNGEVVKDYSGEIWPEDEIELALPEMEAVPPVDEMRIFENENVIVVDKPVGFLSMRKASLLTEPALEDYGFLVHRLDRLTSGVVIIAKNEETRGYLQRQFQQRKVHKTYFAIVEGRMKIPEAEISVPIKRNLARPTTFKVSAEGREAETYYRVVAESEKYSLVELKPRTGRTHQLRIHMKYVGNPIVG